jgi:murein peptide amidase A
MRALRQLGCALLLALTAALFPAAPAGAGGGYYTQLAPVGGIAQPGSPYRFQTLTVGSRHRLTIVEQVRRHGGLIGRRWLLGGSWHLNAPAYDREGTGLAAHGQVLVVSRYGAPGRSGLRSHTELAFLDTGPYRPHGPRPIRRATLPGDYTVQAITPDGEFVYLSHNLALSAHGPRFTLVPYSVRARLLLPANDIRANGEILSGSAIARTADASGHQVYTLYMDPLAPHGRMHVLALDTVAASLTKIELPQLDGTKNPLLLDLHLSPSGHFLTVRKHSARRWVHREPVVARVDLRKVASHPPPSPTATATAATSAAEAVTGPLGSFSHTIGESRQGRPIEMREVGDLALPMHVLVFACIHGDECGASAVEPLRNGCPDPDAHVDVVPNLDPDGSATRSRLNGAGVDLNRNFPVDWRPIGSRGDPEYAGPHPFSEPESRLAARLVRRLHPRVTIWFHQHWGAGSFVRAWGQSAPAARRFAADAGLGFRLIPWPAGTAPNWQNHRFPGTASFVVELPRGKLPQARLIRIDEALGRFGKEVGEDPRQTRKG